MAPSRALQPATPPRGKARVETEFSPSPKSPPFLLHVSLLGPIEILLMCPLHPPCSSPPSCSPVLTFIAPCHTSTLIPACVPPPPPPSPRFSGSCCQLSFPKRQCDQAKPLLQRLRSRCPVPNLSPSADAPSPSTPQSFTQQREGTEPGHTPGPGEPESVTLRERSRTQKVTCCSVQRRNVQRQKAD